MYGLGDGVAPFKIGNYTFHYFFAHLACWGHMGVIFCMHAYFSKKIYDFFFYKWGRPWGYVHLGTKSKIKKT